MTANKKREEIVDIKSRNKWLEIHISMPTRKALLIVTITLVILVFILILMSKPEMQSRALETFLAVMNALAAAWSSQKK